MSAAGPSQGRLHEWGEAQDRRSRPRVRAAADARLPRRSRRFKEPANYSPSGGSAAAQAASVGVQKSAQAASLLAAEGIASGISTISSIDSS